jgi:hypothetical protein
MAVQVGDISVDRFCFLRKRSAYGSAKAVIQQIVARLCANGQEAACEFMFALCARFEALQSAADGMLDTLVIAQFEM